LSARIATNDELPPLVAGPPPFWTAPDAQQVIDPVRFEYVEEYGSGFRI